MPIATGEDQAAISRPGFTGVDNAIFDDKRLTRAMQAVLIAVLSFAWPASRKCTARIKEIAARARYSERAAAAALHDLNAAGYFEVFEHRIDGLGAPTTNLIVPHKRLYKWAGAITAGCGAMIAGYAEAIAPGNPQENATGSQRLRSRRRRSHGFGDERCLG